MIRLLWTLVLSLTLQAQGHSFPAPVTVDENGHWVLRVELAKKNSLAIFFEGTDFLWIPAALIVF